MILMSKLPHFCGFSVQFDNKKFIFPQLQTSANMEIHIHIQNNNLIAAENLKMSLNLSAVSVDYEFRDHACNLTQILNNIEFPGSILNSKGFHKTLHRRREE